VDETDSPEPEFRHLFVARYGHFRIDRVWSRTNAADAREHPAYHVVFEIDTSSEFGVLLTESYVKPQAVPTPSELYRSLTQSWLPLNRQNLARGKPSLACYRRRIGPPDGEHEATPGEWHRDELFRCPGKPLIGLREAVTLVEAALHELEEKDTGPAE
jgi:hypothetical protein